MAVMASAKSSGGGSKMLEYSPNYADQYNVGGYWNTGPGADLRAKGNPLAQYATSYGREANNNPLAGYADKFGAAADKIYGANNFYGQYKAPNWDDPAVMAKLNSYRTMMQGPQMQSAADMLRAASNMGVRGGMTMTGGRSNAANMYKDQISNIAGQSATLYDQALNWLDKNMRWDYQLSRDQFGDYADMMRQQLAAAQAAADWRKQMLASQFGAAQSASAYDVSMSDKMQADWAKQTQLNQQAAAEQKAARDEAYRRQQEQAAAKAQQVAAGTQANLYNRYENLVNNWPLQKLSGGADPRVMQEYLQWRMGMMNPRNLSNTVNTSYSSPSSYQSNVASYGG